MNIHFDKQSIKLLYLLLLADVGFMLLHWFYLKNLLPGVFASPELFSIEKDRGFAEVYQYVKEFWVVILLIILAGKRKQVIYFSWSTLFFYLLLDDSLRIHEKLGRYVGKTLGFHSMFNLRTRDFGELAVLAVVGILLFFFISVSYVFSDEKARAAAKQLFVLMICLVFFGVFVDMLHIAVPWGKSLWGFIEDGGEMLVMSLILCFVFNLRAA